MIEASRTDGALVIIPTFDEAQNIESIVSRLRRSVPEARVLVMGDNLSDGTGKLADAMAEQDDYVRVLHRKGREGLGAAYLAGSHWGLERGYGVLVEYDANSPRQPEQLPSLLAILEHADTVKGSRWVKGGSVVNWPWTRRFLSRGGSLYIRLMLGMPYRDITGGFNAFRADVLAGIIDLPVDRRGYGIQRDLTWHAHRAELRIVEVPIEFVEREFGDSKMDGTAVRKTIVSTTKMGLRRRWQRLRKLFGRHRG